MNYYRWRLCLIILVYLLFPFWSRDYYGFTISLLFSCGHELAPLAVRRTHVTELWPSNGHRSNLPWPCPWLKSHPRVLHAHSFLVYPLDAEDAVEDSETQGMEKPRDGSRLSPRMTLWSRGLFPSSSSTTFIGFCWEWKIIVLNSGDFHQ